MTTVLRLVLLLMCGVLAAPDAQAQSTNWVNDWFDSSTTTSAGRYESQQRGYYTLGSFQGRWRMSNDYLVSAQPPKYQVGCGGIDLFGGGFSFLDPEYLVEKFERMIQAAPAFAFDLALQEFCKPCVATMQALEDITSQLNSMQINDCRLSKKLAAVIVPRHTEEDLASLKEEASSVVSVGRNLRKNWQAFQDASRASNGEPPDDTKPLLEGCTAVFRDVYANGSVVANISRLVGMNAYEDLIRGLIGDVIVTPRATQYAVNTLDACPGNDQVDVGDMIAGTVELKAATGECRASGESRVVDIIDARLTGIADRIRGASALTAEDIAFIQNSPLPVYALIRDAAIAGTVNESIAMVREPLAIAYAQKILDDLIRSTRTLMVKAREIEQNSRADGASPNACNTEHLKGAVLGVQEMVQSADQFRAQLHSNYTKRSAELLTQLQAARELYEIRKQTVSRQAVTMKP